MDELFVLQIKGYALSQPRSIPFEPVSARDVEEAEARLGFSIPTLLKLVFLKVGNGGFGPGRGGCLIGLKGGYESDFGTLVETYEQLKGDQELEGKEWKTGLLPFCEWGCNIFSCVDCNEAHHPVYSFEDFGVRPQHYTLHDFFKMWISGVDILSHDAADSESAEIVNPFTDNRTRVTKRKKKKKKGDAAP